jgi:hypothetical protein
MTNTSENDPKADKNPANHTQRKKGECPNPKGRRRRGEAESYSDLFDRISNEKITIYENGRAICVRKRQLLAMRVVDRGIAGASEFEKILIRVEQPDLTPPAGSLHIVDVDSEDEIPARQRELLRRRKHRANTGDPSPARFGRGRPRHDAPFAELIKRELNKRIEVQEDSRTFTITKREVWMRRLWKDAINGDPRALRTYAKLAKPTEPPPEDRFFWMIGGR